MSRKYGFLLLELPALIVIGGILAVIAIPFFIREYDHKHTNTNIDKEYRIGVNEYIIENISIGYQGMLSPSCFAIDHYPMRPGERVAFYPVGIDTLFNYKHAYLVKEVYPKYIIIKQLY